MEDMTKRKEILEALPESVRKDIAEELHDDERLIWVAQPSASGVVSYSSVYFLFGIPLLAVFMLLFIAALFKGMTLLSILPLPMVFVGINITLAPIRLAAQGHKTIYALTSERLLFVLGYKGGGVKTIGLHQIVSIRRNHTQGGRANLVIQTEFESDESRNHLPFPVRFPDSVLIGLENPRDIHLLIEKQIHMAR